MEIFQRSVIQKHLKNLDKEKVSQAFQVFKKYYRNIKRIENIKQLKEENYQYEFLREIFAEVLRYTINPDENYNLTTEFKNLTDSKKADGAILKDGKAIGVIELKSLKTKNLENIKEQAFNYKNNQPDCRYVITSNFQKLRFYIDNATEFEEFDLFNFSEERFAEFYLILNKENLFNDLPIKLKEETKFHEQNISKQFYKTYSDFKKNIFRNLVKNNPQYDELTLFKKSQKFLDRLLFMFFAEDTGLVPPNAISKIIEDWQKLQELEAYQPLYSRFKFFFEHLDKGHKFNTYELPPYNGGLFAPDDILQNVKINDEILKDDSLKLSAYDFNTDVDVNILGHIFEHSLSEIEEISAKILGETSDKKKTKRKKGGIFYTPQYITQYIVGNTVGTLCKEKKQELGISDIDIDDSYFWKLNKKKLSQKGKELEDKLEQYKKWLLSLKILDPACGSGAFLNQALNFLINEHNYIIDIEEELNKEQLLLFNVGKEVLEHNLFGVDINEESVEIAQLSLWLRTAKKGRKLSDLSNNIKCGNSLIDDPEIAGDKAFNWNKEFPEIMKNGGFDVVIGNPPYVRQELLKGIKPFLKTMYKCYSSKADLYTYFFERGLLVLKKNGQLGYISPNKFINSNYGLNLRKLLYKFQIEKIIDFGELPVFSDAATFPAIYIMQKRNQENVTQYSKILNFHQNEFYFEIENNKLLIEITNEDWKFFDVKEIKLINKFFKNSIKLYDYVHGEIKFGLKTGLNDAYIIDKKKRDELIREDSKCEDIIYPFIDGSNVRKYLNVFDEKYIIAAKKGRNLEKYTPIINHFNKFRKQLENRSDKGDKWYQLRPCSYYNYFEKPKILYPDIALESRFSFDNTGIYPNATLFIIPRNDKFLLTLLNSKLAWFYFARNCPVIGEIHNRGRLRLKTIYISNLPIKTTSTKDKQPFIEKADIMLSLNKQLQEKKNKFINRLETNFEIEKLSNKLKSFYKYDFKTFLTELKKQKIKLSLKLQDEWEDYFSSYKKEINKLQFKINKTDNEIDQMVYELYGLTDEEIKIVEESSKT